MSGLLKSDHGPPTYGQPFPGVFLGDDDKEKTFQYDDSLPSLPVPPLDHTLKKYLESVQPHLTSDEFRRTQNIVKEFENGIGRDLNRKLLEKAKSEKNWVEKWWEDYAYLMNREPHAPFVNFGGPTPYSMEPDAWPPCDGTQLERAALIAWYMLLFWDLLRNEKLRVDRGGKTTIWSMHQFTRMFNGCKTPGESMDKLNHYFKPASEGTIPSHILIICKGRYFTFDSLDAAGHIITAPEIEIQLRRIRRVCDGQPDGPGVGALTGGNRTMWYQERQHLISLSPLNERHLSDIQTSIFVIVLDDREPVSLDELSWEALGGDAKNRWFDKTNSAITFKNGLMASNCDHAPHDAMVNVVISYFNYVGLETSAYKWLGPKEIRPMAAPRELIFKLDDRSLKAIEDAALLYKKSADGLRIHSTRFNGIGKNFIKTHNLHPDTFVQMGMQYGYYLLHGKPAPTYETASTRKYYHGRTETLRSCTMESFNWTKSMADPNASNQTRYKLLLAAIDKHNRNMAECVENHGCDRHLFGLQVIALESGQKLPDIFLDPAYVKSGGNGNFILSTSCVGYTPVFGGVAPMCKNGYGFFYSIEPELLNLYCCSWVADTETNEHKLHESVKRALLDMKRLLETTKDSKL